MRKAVTKKAGEREKDMDNITFKECVSNADAAFSNSQYEAALEWYQKALQESADDLHCLSRAGAICVMFKKFDEALQHFENAVSVDSENGDNYFNLGNAYFFCGKYALALKQYALAEQKGCSEDVLPRMYYQYGMPCSIRQDPKGALVQFEKCEKADKEGTMGLNPDLISEKLKMYLMLQDYENAEQTAAQLIMVAPSEYKYYAVYSSILTAHGKFEKAVQVCEDAENYAQLTEEERFSFMFQKAAIYADAGDTNKEYYQKGYDLLNNWLESNPNLELAQKRQALATLAELCSKMGEFDKGIELVKQVLGKSDALLTSKSEGENQKTSETAYSNEPMQSGKAWDDQVDLMLQTDMEMIQDNIDAGLIDEDMGTNDENGNYDENGNFVHDYGDIFAGLISEIPNVSDETRSEEPQEEPSQKQELEESEREKLSYVLITCYLGKDDYSQAYDEARRLMTSSDTYFAYYGRYVEALAYRKICKDKQKVDYKYARTMAYFRTQYLRNAADPLPNLFRVRMYAECGEFVKAKELTSIMGEAERISLMNYIKQCEETKA